MKRKKTDAQDGEEQKKSFCFRKGMIVLSGRHKQRYNITEELTDMITINLYYTGKNGSARKFAQEMERSGIADAIRKEPGNLRYQYFMPMDDEETVLLIDAWRDQEAIDRHHASAMMKELAALREKYDLHMKAERYISEEFGNDEQYIRK